MTSTSDTTPGIKQPGEVNLTKILLYNAKRNNKPINLIMAMLQLDIYEDIFSPTLSGTLTVVESFNLVSSLPLIGDEVLEIEYSTPSMKEVARKLFYVTKVDSVTHGGDSKIAYAIHFVTREAVVDLQSKLSKAYSGNASDIVRNICTNDLKISADNIDISSSNNTIKFVSPFWSPFQCVNFAVSRCLYPGNTILTPNYLFFQTTSKFKLKSLTELFNQEPIVEYYFDKNPGRHHLADGTSTGDLTRIYQTVKELEIIQSQDFIKNTMDGALSHKVYGVNLIGKQFTQYKYNIHRDFNKTKHLEEFPLTSPNAEINDHGLLSSTVNYPTLFSTEDDRTPNILTARIPLLSQLELFKLEIVVPGVVGVEAGMVIKLKLNTYSETDISEKDKEKFDRMYSGKYLITAIQHSINQTMHMMNMQISKDSSLERIKMGMTE